MNVSLADLESLLPPDDVYPAGVVLPIRPRIMGRSFFPGGCGLAYGHDQPYPHRPIMLVGQDFGTRTYWEKLTPDDHVRGEPNSSGTWKHIGTWARQGLLPANRCYFTNVLCGIRDDVADPSIQIDGESPGLDHPVYLRASVECLLRQIDVLQPSAVVGLGCVPVTLLARGLGIVPDCWPRSRIRRGAGIATWEEIDSENLQFVSNVQTGSGQTFVFASSVHPDRYWLNTKWRRWPSKGLAGDGAHEAIWKSVREHDASARGPSPA